MALFMECLLKGNNNIKLNKPENNQNYGSNLQDVKTILESLT